MRWLLVGLLVLTACAPETGGGPQGWEWSESSCPGGTWYPPAPGTAKPLPEDVSTYTLCGTDGEHVNVARGTARFDRLTRTFSASYDEPDPHATCTMQLDRDVPVWARTDDRVYLVRQPRDRCGHLKD